MQKYLLSGGGFEAQVTPAWGADILSLRWAGRDVLVPLNSEEQREKNPFLHGSPLLLPANRTVDGRFRFENREYRLPINEEFNHCHLHGALFRQTFSVLQATQDTFVAEYVNRGEIFPFPFRITVTYTVSAAGFQSEYAIENLSDGRMPLTFALHTTFCEPDYFRVPIGLCQERRADFVPTGNYLPLDALQSSYHEGTYSAGKRVYGYYTAAGTTMTIGDFEYNVSENFDYRILYNADGAGGFLCAEPQCGEVNGLNGKCKVLDSGETAKFFTVIRRKP